MTLRQEAYVMIDSLPDDDSIKFFIDMIRQFNIVIRRIEEISKTQNLFRKRTSIFTHGGTEKEVSIPQRL